MGSRALIFISVSVSAIVLASLSTPAAAAAPATRRASIGSAGQQPNGGSYTSATSSNGRYIAFTSAATNVVPGDTNGRQDVFVRDRTAGTTTEASVSSAGKQTTGDSVQPSISGDGRYVVFSSDSAELVSGDLSGQFDIFIRDMVAKTTRRLSVGMGAAEANGGSSEPVITPDGKHVAFLSTASNLVLGDANGQADAFVATVATGTITLASTGSGGQADAPSFGLAISADGRYVAFVSRADNLVSYDPNGAADVFVRDLQHGVTRRISQSASGTPGDADSGLNYVAMSADARYIAFGSAATNLVAGDTNGVSDVFVRDRVSGAVSRVSIGPGGVQGNGDSGFLFDIGMSANGRYIAFASEASNLVAGDTNATFDVFVRDITAGRTLRVSVSSAGAQANSASINPAVSADGQHVAFQSVATNLVTGDTNRAFDVFVRDQFAG